MTHSELIDLIQKKDTSAKKHWFDTFYGRFSAIAQRYSKNAEQAEKMLFAAMHKCYERVQETKGQDLNSESAMRRLFLEECIRFVKNIRSEYYVASTVNAADGSPATKYDLFETSEGPDINEADLAVMLPALQKLAPAQRLIFNLHVIDGLSLDEAAEMMESSEATVKSNLEKARFSFQKNIENNLKTAKQ